MAGGGESGKAVIMAIAVNSVLTIVKFAAYFFSGSGAMLAESIHTAADLGNQVLLYVGLRQSRKTATETYNFGYGKERFLWALISAAGIFFLGCGVSVTHGIHELMDPAHKEPIGWMIVAVLTVNFLLDGIVLWTAFKELNTARKGMPWMIFLRTTNDTTTLAVFFEDSAACLGVLLAAAGIAAYAVFGWWWADAVAAIAIGLLLGVVALFLGKQNRTYLLDAAISGDAQAKMLALIREHGKSVKDIFRVHTRVIGADQFAFKADVEFDGKVLSDRIMSRMKIEEVFQTLKTPEDLDRLLDEHARVVVDELGNEVDRIEKAVTEAVPGAKFIQLEPD
jgi:solute carrier family 30 (zinc transporter), member 9